MKNKEVIKFRGLESINMNLSVVLSENYYKITEHIIEDKNAYFSSSDTYFLVEYTPYFQLVQDRSYNGFNDGVVGNEIDIFYCSNKKFPTEDEANIFIEAHRRLKKEKVKIVSEEHTFINNEAQE